MQEQSTFHEILYSHRQMEEGESSVGMILLWKTAAGGGVLGGLLLGRFLVLGCLGANTSLIAVGIGTHLSLAEVSPS
jgi:hypothetical protein